MHVRNRIKATLSPIGSALALAAIGAACSVSWAQSGGVEYSGGIRVSQTFSDNIGRAPAGEESFGGRTEVSPYVSAEIDRQRMRASVRYALRGFYEYGDDARTTESSVRHDLRSTLDALLAGDWLGFRASANIYNVNRSPFGLVSPDPAVDDQNSVTVYSYTLAPYLEWRAGAFAVYRAEYSFNRTESSQDLGGILVDNNQRLSASVVSGPRFNRWGWSLSGVAQRTEFDTGFAYDRKSAQAGLFYVISPSLRTGVSVNYDNAEDFTTADGESSGWGLGASVDWVPSQRTSVSASIADQYWGTQGSIYAAHRTQRWTFSVMYDRTLRTGRDLSVLVYDPNAAFAIGGFPAELNPLFQDLIEQGVLSGISVPIGLGLISDGLVLDRRLTLTVGYSFARGGAAITAYQSRQDTELSATVIGAGNDPIVLDAFGRREQIGISASASLRLNAKTSIGASAGASQITDRDDDRRTRLYTATGSVSVSVSRNLTTSFGVRRAVQTTENVPQSGYEENQVYGTVDYKLF